MPETEQLGEVVGVFMEYKKLHSEVRINLRDRRELIKDMDQPMVC